MVLHPPRTTLRMSRGCHVRAHLHTYNQLYQEFTRTIRIIFVQAAVKQSLMALEIFPVALLKVDSHACLIGTSA